jgi:hypothetical protein
MRTPPHALVRLTSVTRTVLRPYDCSDVAFNVCLRRVFFYSQGSLTSTILRMRWQLGSFTSA